MRLSRPSGLLEALRPLLDDEEARLRLDDEEESRSGLPARLALALPQAPKSQPLKRPLYKAQKVLTGVSPGSRSAIAWLSQRGARNPNKLFTSSGTLGHSSDACSTQAQTAPSQETKLHPA